MKVEQKYTKGNLVKVIQKYHHSYIMNMITGKPENTKEPFQHYNKLAIIKEFSNPQGNMKQYSIIFLDTGNSYAWINEDELEFVEEGGEHLFKQAKENEDRIYKQHTDLKWIKDNFNNDFKDGLTSSTILFLFNKIGFDSSFNRNGEYYILFSNWEEREDMFKHLFKGNRESMETEIKRFYKPQYQEQYLNSFSKLFDEVVVL